MTRRLIVGYLAITVVVLVLLEVPFGIYYGQRERDRLTAAVERDASVIATFYEENLENGTVPDPLPADDYAERTGARVVVVDGRGISIVDTGASTPRDFSTRPEIRTALAGHRATGTRGSETLGSDLLYVAVPVASEGVVHGAVRLTLDTDEVNANVHRFWWGLAAIGAVVLAAMGLVGRLIARSVTLPLRRLNDAAQRYGAGDLTVDPGVEVGPPELRELSATMATMAAQLDAMIDEQRLFVADASHQLRTPLTVLRLRLENLQAQLDDEEGEQVDAAIDEIDRLAALVTDLLHLARADRRAPAEAQDLTALTGDRVDTWTAVAEGAGVTLRVDLPDGVVTASAVPGAIEQILDNVLDNAIGVSPPGSTVVVAVEPGTTTHRLVVIDEGPGLSDADKAHATGRFWRGSTTRPGTGLGLAIVRSLATASAGSVELADAPGGGLRVIVAFPAATAFSLG
ncbi:MAG: HAMP domain-containing protein [Actinobacteria bacterium]|nr:HAMP domain-containing protein [Actinomycetota bacterium]MCB0907582.1 HAMP domain-containing protein [Nocardioidaceae bacterium]